MKFVQLGFSEPGVVDHLNADVVASSSTSPPPTRSRRACTNVRPAATEATGLALVRQSKRRKTGASGRAVLDETLGGDNDPSEGSDTQAVASDRRGRSFNPENDDESFDVAAVKEELESSSLLEEEKLFVAAYLRNIIRHPRQERLQMLEAAIRDHLGPLIQDLPVEVCIMCIFIWSKRDTDNSTQILTDCPSSTALFVD